MKKKNKKLGGRPTNRPNEEWLLKIYKTETASEIGEMFDVSAGTVRSWICRIRKEQNTRKKEN